MRKDLIKFIIFVLILIGTLGMIVKQSVQNEPLKVVFFGDSITQFGWENQNGYVQQVVERLTNSGVNILPIPAGICGHTSKNMLDRMDKDVLAKKPDIMFFMGGLNDIWLNKGTFEDYKENITAILDKAQKNDIKVYLMNLTVISEDLDSSMNKEIDRYNEFLSEIAKEKNITLIDVSSAVKAEIRKSNKNSAITTDGVHLNDKGNTILANTIVNKYLEENK